MIAPTFIISRRDTPDLKSPSSLSTASLSAALFSPLVLSVILKRLFHQMIESVLLRGFDLNAPQHYSKA